MPMHTRTRTLRFTAVLALVVLSLTGFSAGRHHSRHGSGGAGGCSSSHQDHDGSSSTSGGGRYDDSAGAYDATGGGHGNGSGTGGGSYRRGATPRSTSSSGGTELKHGKARLVSCATEKAPYATVEVANPNRREADFRVQVEFAGEQDTTVARNSARVTVPADGSARVHVDLVSASGPRDDGLIQEVDHCTVDPVAEPVD
ncbi:hypothetical protein [Streptomyces sp. NPDC006193]|uniref:hypothetical protein n=1 Tax=Streptomyces sp. NPDC006193 TaxID=3155717 RepID=UPI0033B5959C